MSTEGLKTYPVESVESFKYRKFFNHTSRTLFAFILSLTICLNSPLYGMWGLMPSKLEDLSAQSDLVVYGELTNIRKYSNSYRGEYYSTWTGTIHVDQVILASPDVLGGKSVEVTWGNLNALSCPRIDVVRGRFGSGIWFLNKSPLSNTYTFFGPEKAFFLPEEKCGEFLKRLKDAPRISVARKEKSEIIEYRIKHLNYSSNPVTVRLWETDGESLSTGMESDLHVFEYFNNSDKNSEIFRSIKFNNASRSSSQVQPQSYLIQDLALRIGGNVEFQCADNLFTRVLWNGEPTDVGSFFNDEGRSVKDLLDESDEAPIWLPHGIGNIVWYIPNSLSLEFGSLLILIAGPFLLAWCLRRKNMTALLYLISLFTSFIWFTLLFQHGRNSIISLVLTSSTNEFYRVDLLVTPIALFMMSFLIIPTLILFAAVKIFRIQKPHFILAPISWFLIPGTFSAILFTAEGLVAIF